MVDQISPLARVYRPGAHGRPGEGIGVFLSEAQPGSIVQLAAWPGRQRAMLDTIHSITGLALPDGAGAGLATDRSAAFGFAPGRFLVVDQDEGLSGRLAAAIRSETGTVTDLSHGRTAIRIAGRQAERVLSKLFAIDFAMPAFPTGSGTSTAHHDFLAQIQRSRDERFDLYVFRSFARSFWETLCRASADVGYEVG